MPLPMASSPLRFLLNPGQHLGPPFFPRTQLSCPSWAQHQPFPGPRERRGRQDRLPRLIPGLPLDYGIQSDSVSQDGKGALSKPCGIGLEFPATLSTPSIQRNRISSVTEREGPGEGRDGPCSDRDFRETVRETIKSPPEGTRTQRLSPVWCGTCPAQR